MVAVIAEAFAAIEEAVVELAGVSTANHSVALTVAVSQTLFKHLPPYFHSDLFRLLSVHSFVDCFINISLFFFAILVDLEQRSPDWKHDMYDSVDDAKPSSTTPI